MGMEEPVDDVSDQLTPSRVGMAFGLVIGSGAATLVGACLAFFTRFQNTKMLAGALGLSSGVMM